MAQPKKRPANGNNNRKGKDVEPALEIDEKKAPGKFQKAFFWVIIPLLFASAILLIFFQVTGTNVFDKAKDIAGVSQSAADKKAATNDNTNEQIVSLKSQLQEKDAEIKQLQDQMDQQKTEAKKTQIEKKRLEKKVRKLQNKKEKASADIEALVATYEQMRPKSSAPTLAAMKDTEAVEIMRKLKTETLAAILEKMDPADAAHFTTLLSKDAATSKKSSSN